MSNPPEARSRLTGLDALAASLEQSLADTARREEDAAIIAALPLRPRPGLYLDRDDTRDDLLVLEDPTGPEDADAIIGLAVPDGQGGFYLGCITCRGEIDEADAGMCQPCREDEAWRDQQHQTSQVQPEGW
jgi:hypothetical protein